MADKKSEDATEREQRTIYPAFVTAANASNETSVTAAAANASGGTSASAAAANASGETSVSGAFMQRRSERLNAYVLYIGLLYSIYY